MSVAVCGWPVDWSMLLSAVLLTWLRCVVCVALVFPPQGQYDFPDPYWTEISENAKDLVRKLLTVDPRHRLTAAQVLQHPWITGGASSKPLSEGHTTRLMMLQARRRLRKGVQMIIAINKFGQCHASMTHPALERGTMTHARCRHFARFTPPTDMYLPLLTALRDPTRLCCHQVPPWRCSSERRRGRRRQSCRHGRPSSHYSNNSIRDTTTQAATEKVGEATTRMYANLWIEQLLLGRAKAHFAEQRAHTHNETSANAAFPPVWRLLDKSDSVRD